MLTVEAAQRQRGMATERPRLAFTALPWGESAVVCRALEDCAGPMVDQQFGIFPTWTEADAFASRLNEGLDLTALQVREIVTSSFLARSRVLSMAESRTAFWNFAPVLSLAAAIQTRFLLAQLDLALTFCSLACTRQEERPSQRLTWNARRVLDQTLLVADGLKPSHSSLREISRKCELLAKALKKVPPAFAPELS